MKAATLFKATVYTLAMHYRAWPRRAAATVAEAALAVGKALAIVIGVVTAPVIAPFVVLGTGVDERKVDEAWAKLWRGCRTCWRTGYIGTEYGRCGHQCPRCGGKGHR